MCLANIFPKKSDALDPQVLHMMTFKTSMKTSYLVATDVEQAVDNCTNHMEMENDILESNRWEVRKTLHYVSYVFLSITFALLSLPKCFTTTQSLEDSFIC